MKEATHAGALGGGEAGSSDEGDEGKGAHLEVERVGRGGR